MILQKKPKAEAYIQMFALILRRKTITARWGLSLRFKPPVGTHAGSLAIVSLFCFGATSYGSAIINLAVEPADIAVYGESLTSNLGTSFATGDVNGDGHQDLITVACNTHPLNSQRTGTVYVFWGDLGSSPPVLNLTQSLPGVSRIYGPPDNDDLWCSVACGDFDDDGFDDIAWGSPQSGRVFIIFGRSPFPPLVDIVNPPPGVVVLENNAENSYFGFGMCSGDMNGDGFADLIASAPWLEYSQVVVVHGREVFPTSIDVEIPTPGLTTIVDDIPNGEAGHGMVTRDINGDGRAELIVGSPGAERTLLLYGVANLPSTILLGNPSVPIKEILGEFSHGHLGVSNAFGDVNGDGIMDAVLSANLGDPNGCSDCGEVYVLYDVNSLAETTHLATTDASMTRIVGYGSRTGDGYRVLCADVSGDAIDDVVITNRPLTALETTSIIYGRSLMPESIALATESGPITRIRPQSNADQLGRGVAALDVNHDLVCDLFIGAPYASPPTANYAGIVYCLMTDDIATQVRPAAPQPRLSAFPNPFAERTTVSFGELGPGNVEASIYDAAGRLVKRLDTFHMGGSLSIDWDGDDDAGTRLSSGVYFCRVTAGVFTETRKLVLVR